MSGDTLTDKQRRFCEEYIVDCNGTQAALRAGYQKRRARGQAVRLRANVTVRSEIERLLAEQRKRTQATADRVIEELALIAFSRITDHAKWNADGLTLTDSTKLPDGAIATIAEVSKGANGTVKVKQHAKIEALRMLGQHFALFGDDGNNNSTGEEPEYRSLLEKMVRSTTGGDPKQGTTRVVRNRKKVQPDSGRSSVV